MGTAASAPFAVYIGVLSGTLGGGWGWSVAKEPGTLIGVVLAITFVAGTILLFGAGVGGAIGHIVDRLMSGGPPMPG